MNRFALACASFLALAACAQQPDTPPVAAAPAPAPTAKVTEIFRGQTTALGQPMRFPRQQGTVVVSLYEIPPGARLPVHRHPQQRIAYVLAGQLRVATPEGRSWDYKAGDVIVEMLDQWHWGETLGSETVRLLVIDQTEGNVTNTELRH